MLNNGNFYHFVDISFLRKLERKSMSIDAEPCKYVYLRGYATTWSTKSAHDYKPLPKIGHWYK